MKRLSGMKDGQSLVFLIPIALTIEVYVGYKVLSNCASIEKERTVGESAVPDGPEIDKRHPRRTLRAALNEAKGPGLAFVNTLGSLASLVAIVLFLAERLGKINGADTREMVWLVCYLAVFVSFGLVTLVAGVIGATALLLDQKLGVLSKMAFGWLLFAVLVALELPVVIGCIAAIQRQVGPLF
ncbi:MAG: hypothetical protein NTX23_07840 [Candidatus Bipolaricaulota bacterium]|nr:hypothetical protein [Candidatus Bipolaricaulota bacterium]